MPGDLPPNKNQGSAPMKNFGFGKGGQLIYSGPRDPGFKDHTKVRRPMDFSKKTGA